MAYMSGTISQDMVTIAASVAMLIFLALYSKKKDMRLYISLIGLLSFYFYAYGVHVISALNTSIYPLYMVIFACSIFGMIFGVSSFSAQDVNKLNLPKWLRVTGAAFLLIIVCVFVPMWASSLIPHIQSHTIPDFYAIFILDLCVVMPFFAAVIYMLFRDYKLSYVLFGIALLKTLTLILSVLIGEITFPAHGFKADTTMITIYGVIIVISSFLLVFYYTKMKYCADINRA